MLQSKHYRSHLDPRHSRPWRRRHVRPKIARRAARHFWLFCALWAVAALLIGVLFVG